MLTMHSVPVSSMGHRSAGVGALLAIVMSMAFGFTAWATTVFSRTLQLHGVRFQEQSSGEGSQRQLSITTSGARQSIAPIRQPVNGSVVGARVADLDGNGQPEIYVFVEGVGRDSYGALVAYALNNGLSLTPITLPDLSASLAQGYRGHDMFSLVEDCLVRRFPLYNPADSDAHAMGGERQIGYKLKAGEANWSLRPTSILRF